MWSAQLQRIPWCQTKGMACWVYYRVVLKVYSGLKLGVLSVTQLSIQNQPSSDDKVRKLKKKVAGKRKSQLEVTKEREDECFFCGDSGQVVSCKKPGCPKVYHADCLNLSRRPAGE